MSGHTLRIPARVENLASVRAHVTEYALNQGASDRAAYLLALAVDEAVTNIIVHGYRGQPGEIEVEVSTENGRLLIHLRDSAPAFDPTTAPEPDLTLPLEERPLGGLGIHLMRRCTDELRYRVLPGGGNEFTMIKTI